MSLSALTPEEREVVRRLMAATFELIDDGEYHTRLGVEPVDVRSLLATWKDIDDSEDHSVACLAINNSLNDILNGVGISEQQSAAIAGASLGEIERIYHKWAAARGWDARGIR